MTSTGVPAGKGLVVHEWISAIGGSERVFAAMATAFPFADLRCLWADRTDLVDVSRLSQTWLSKSPLRRSKVAALPFMPFAWRRPPQRGYDWALVSSHLFAHHVAVPGARKYVYVHSPARYIWEPEVDSRAPIWLSRLAGAPLRPLDRRRAGEAYAIAANSRFVRARIERVWGREADVVYPPVDVQRIANGAWIDDLTQFEADLLDSLRGPFLLGASRFVAYKQVDVVLAVAERVGLPLVVAGSGPGEQMLRARAVDLRVPVHFVVAPSDALLYALYARAVAYVFPAIEDFGIMPVEAMAAGCPVIARAVGGVSESVVDGVSGALLAGDFVQDAAAAVDLVSRLERSAIPGTVAHLDAAHFSERIRSWMAR